MRIAERELIFPELSYQVVGAAFRVFNGVGYGFSEKVYQKAMAKEFDSLGLKFNREVYLPLNYKNKLLVRFFADFIVDGKIVVELKVVKKLNYSHARQVLEYLRNSGVRLGILLYFTSDGVKYRRVVNSSVKT